MTTDTVRSSATDTAGSDTAGSDTAETAQFSAETSKTGAFVRQANRFTDRVTADGSSGYSAVAGRYHLIVSLACPWAHRSVIDRELLGLQDVIGLSVVDPIRDERGWRFTLSPQDRDPASGAEFLSELYLASDPDYTGRFTVPTLWDAQTRRVVTNDYPQLSLDLSTEWSSFHRAGAPALYPEHLRAEIDEVNRLVYTDVNNGVYKAGFATSQQAYEQAYDALFARLDWLTDRLSGQRYLVGDQLTEADVRLFTTLVRFDAVYHGHFKCNRTKLSEVPVLWDYARDLFQTPGIGETVDFDQIKRHYYATHEAINPTRIVPKGPLADAWHEPHNRAALT